ncbi:MAG TPA: PA2169 family four-helix-bundle protein, partial [Noviherbaspirillum sp.]
MHRDDLVDVLNALIETCKDGTLGFRVCSEDASDLQLRTFFANRAQGCTAAAAELEELVRMQGAQPASGGGWG